MRLSSVLVIIFSTVYPFAVFAETLKPGQSLGIETQSKSAYLFDLKDGKPIFLKNPDEVLPLASLTKLMTALVIYEQKPNWNKLVKFEVSDRREGGIPYLIPGEEVKREDLWNLMLSASSNDATVALVRSLGFSLEKFTSLMNERADELGLKHITFKEPSGLDPENKGTAREVAALSRIIFSVPKIRESLLQTSYIFAPKGKQARRAKSTNALLFSFLNKKPYYIISGKTGYLEEGQYNLVLSVGKKNERELVGVLLGNPTSDGRFQEMKSLIWWGFRMITEQIRADNKQI